MTAWKSLAKPYRYLIGGGNALQPVLLLIFRLWVAQVFFNSGLTKIADWDTTLLLFTEEYHVPLLSPAVAACLGTLGELGLSTLFVLGLATRFAAIGLFILNAVAVISYPGLTDVTRQFHYYWAMLIMALLAFGAGRFSLDYWLQQRWHKSTTETKKLS
ncbi:DoxX family protein [Neisseriaceae bacterium TC5R-5]|nr:DoxX family protein [Neisseriaceae bacterium TC5R-5]